MYIKFLYFESEYCIRIKQGIFNDNKAENRFDNYFSELVGYFVTILTIKE